MYWQGYTCTSGLAYRISMFWIIPVDIAITFEYIISI